MSKVRSKMNNNDLANELRKIASDLDPYAALEKNPSLLQRFLQEGRVSKRDGQKFIDAMNKFLAKHPDQVERVLQQGLVTQEAIDPDTLIASGIVAKDLDSAELKRKHFPNL